jgi:nuclear pore complex protein Nup155
LNSGRTYVPPTCLKLSNVLPPPVTAALQQGAKIHEAFYSNGLTVASQAFEDLDRVLVFSPHAGAISQSTVKVMSEYSSYCDIEGRTWAIAEHPSEQVSIISKEKSYPGLFLNELATQFDFGPRTLYLLTNGGLTTLTKLRPIDLFLKLINSTASNDVKAFQEFFNSFGAEQCCAMCLAIICDHPSVGRGHNSIGPNVSNFAKRLYFEMGGVPSVSVSQNVQNVPTSNEQLIQADR